jgi:hypothetical protein
MSRQGFSEIPVQVRQGGHIPLPTVVKRMIELATVISRLPQRLHESFQLLAIKPHKVMA